MTINCAHCGKQFDCSPSRQARGVVGCSLACRNARWKANIDKRIMASERECAKCHQTKSTSEFYAGGNATKRYGGVGSWCKECRCNDERRRRNDPNVIHKFHAKYETDEHFRAREILRAIGKRCRRRNIPLDLDIDWLATRFRNGRCEITGLPFNMSVAARKSNPHTPSVDRIDPAKGYTKDNCRVVLLAVNIALMNWGMDVLMPIAEALVARHPRRISA
jgi:hypothetical protein